MPESRDVLVAALTSEAVRYGRWMARELELTGASAAVVHAILNAAVRVERAEVDDVVSAIRDLDNEVESGVAIQTTARHSFDRRR